MLWSLVVSAALRSPSCCTRAKVQGPARCGVITGLTSSSRWTKLGCEKEVTASGSRLPFRPVACQGLDRPPHQSLKVIAQYGSSPGCVKHGRSTTWAGCYVHSQAARPDLVHTSLERVAQHPGPQPLPRNQPAWQHHEIVGWFMGTAPCRQDAVRPAQHLQPSTPPARCSAKPLCQRSAWSAQPKIPDHAQPSNPHTQLQRQQGTAAGLPHNKEGRGRPAHSVPCPARQMLCMEKGCCWAGLSWNQARMWATSSGHPASRGLRHCRPTK